MAIRLLLLLLGTFGNCWFWSSYVNRLYSFRLHDRVLNRCRKVHDIAIFLVPVLLAATLWLPQSGTSSDLIEQMQTEPWRLIPWSFPLLGLLFFAVTKIRKVLERKPPGFQKTDSTIVDVPATLSSRPVAPGPYHGLLNVPGNQALTFELNHKQFVLPKLPAECDGLRVLHLSDLHLTGVLTLPYYETLIESLLSQPVDVICFTGDLLDDPQLAAWLSGTLGRLTAPLGKYFILGNHDWHLEVPPIRAALEDLGWLDCAGTVHLLEHQGCRIALGGDERPWMGTAPDFSTQAGADLRWLLSHTPDNIDWARKHHIDLMLSGHNHGGQIKLPLIGPVFAPSRYGVRFTDGEFWLSPTALHVSRGISGRHPLRIRCRPEVSILTLRSPEASP